MTSPIKDDFAAALRERLEVASASGHDMIEVTAGDLHGAVGGYPARNHRMPLCCQVMRDAMKPGDDVMSEPPSGQGASLKIRYRLPR